MSGRPLIDNENDIVLILDQPHYSGCEYGRPNGPDDYINTCDCEMTKEIANEYLNKHLELRVYALERRLHALELCVLRLEKTK